MTDAGGLVTKATFVIDLTDVDEAPTDILVTGGAVQENAAQGTVVATLAAVGNGDTTLDNVNEFQEILTDAGVTGVTSSIACENRGEGSGVIGTSGSA